MSQTPISNLIHLHCDGELTPEQDAALKRHLESHPEDRDSLQHRIEFECRLRSRVGLVMASESAKCPLELQAAVRARLAGEPQSTIQPASARATSRSVNPRSSGVFKFPQRANLLAIAATLALIAGAVLYGIFGRGIDETPPLRSVDLVAAAAMYADSEHVECASDNDKLSQRAPMKAAPEIEDDFKGWLGSPVKVFDLQAAGYEFVGAGHCNVPVADRSCRLVYRKASGPGGRSPMLSIFVVPTGKACHGKLCEKQIPGEWYPISGCRIAHKVVQSTDGKLVYFMVCCKDRDLDAITPLMAMGTRPTGH